MRKRFLLGLLILTAALTAQLRAQEPAPVPMQVIEVPSCKPTQAEVITFLTKYDIQHKRELIDGRYWGLTFPDIKLVLISDAAKGEDAKYVVIHELTHVCFREKGIKLPYDVEEFVVDLQARQQYQELFGAK